MTSLARRRTGRDKNLVGFTVADVHYAVDIKRVREIIRPLELVSIPHAPPAILGVADYRGEVVPVLDVRRRFSLPDVQATRRTKWIVVELGARLAALVVDSVTEVYGRNEQERRAVPELGVGDAARGIQAVYPYAGSLVFVIDIDRIAAVADVLDLSALGRGLIEEKR